MINENLTFSFNNFFQFKRPLLKMLMIFSGNSQKMRSAEMSLKLLISKQQRDTSPTYMPTDIHIYINVYLHPHHIKF